MTSSFSTGLEKGPITSSSGAIAILAVGLLIHAAPADEQKMVMRDAVSHEDLVEVASEEKAAGTADPMSVFRLAETAGEQASKPEPSSLISRSEILTLGGKATLVPKRAVIHIPDQYKGRLSLSPGVRIVTWTEFYAMNRGWIDTVDIDRKVAEGLEQLPEEFAERFSKRGKVVVATLLGRPVSVMPYVEPVEEEISETPVNK